MTTAARTDARTALIRWGSFYGDSDFELTFPAGWDVNVHEPAGGDDIGDEGIAAAFDNPIGSARIRELARGKRSACIVVDDLTRPTPAARLAPRVIEELVAAGIEESAILILGGVANHRQMTREDFVRKVGEDIASRFELRSHFSWANCESVGETSRGTPVSLNSEFLAAEVRILIGSILPHNKTGFSGGAKLVLPGVAHIDTAAAWHGPEGPTTGLVQTASESRLDAEEAARLAGVDCIVNVIPNIRRGIAGLVVGDLVEAHRAGVEIARRTYATKLPTGVDVCVLSVLSEGRRVPADRPRLPPDPDRGRADRPPRRHDRPRRLHRRGRGLPLALRARDGVLRRRRRRAQLRGRAGPRLLHARPAPQRTPTRRSRTHRAHARVERDRALAA